MLSQLKGENWKTSLAFLLAFSEGRHPCIRVGYLKQKCFSSPNSSKKINLHILLLYKEHTSSSTANMHSSSHTNPRD